MPIFVQPMKPLRKPFRLTTLFKEFFASQQSAGLLLVLCTILSLVLANGSIGESYRAFWNTEIGTETGGFHLKHSITDWVNEALMIFFFLLVGLEIERELYIGELSDRKQAMLPLMGALGGMIVPALIYCFFNFNSLETLSGAGIPTATDIAFAVAIMGILGNRVPMALKVFLVALAIIDDLGAILVIGLFYGSSFQWEYIAYTAAICGVLYWLNQKQNTNPWIYLCLGVLLWFSMLHSGIHPTLAGVIIAFAIPFQDGKPNTVSYRLEHKIQWPVGYIILPLFALSNTAIDINTDIFSQLLGAEGLGIFFGLTLGKPIGIVLFSFLAIRLGIARLSENISKTMLLGAAILGGIGFTMAIFVDNLAFANPKQIELGKISILLASACSALIGYSVLRFSKTKP